MPIICWVLNLEGNMRKHWSLSNEIRCLRSICLGMLIWISWLKNVLIENLSIVVLSYNWQLASFFFFFYFSFLFLFCRVRVLCFIVLLFFFITVCFLFFFWAWNKLLYRFQSFDCNASDFSYWMEFLLLIQREEKEKGKVPSLEVGHVIKKWAFLSMPFFSKLSSGKW